MLWYDKYMKRYNPSEIEPKWQKRWEESGAYKAEDFSEKPKKYVAGQFPYPSGAGLHVGHARVYAIVDAVSRFYRQLGYNVLNPIGWDTFGLPAENYAIKTGISPQSATKTNIANFKKQFKRLGISVDWSREINTSDPEYYKWTQWIFTQLFEKGLAYRAENYQWWCPKDKTVLANEQVEGGHCWRCGSVVEKRKMNQWFFKITDHAEELLADLDQLDWPEKIKTMQRNWIGKSEGAEVEFEVVDGADARKIKIFTTRPDTIYGATFLVLAPEHPLVNELTNELTRPEVDKYRQEAMKKSEIERQENKEKTGVFTGSYAKNPLSGEKMAIWVADYVLMGYGEGAIMAVPAHDERDLEFAEKFDLPVKEVIKPPANFAGGCYTGEGEMINSGRYDGKPSAQTRELIVKLLEKNGQGRAKTTYKMRDWLISRQRYWGAPIPVAYDADGKPHVIPESQLPVVLPEITDYQPDDSGHSALAKVPEFMQVELNGEKMTRETDTLDGFACSSWYLLRYCDPSNEFNAWDKTKADYWSPVDVYVGADHAVTHQLYVRFWAKFFADQGLTNFREPIKSLLYSGYINAEDGTKMSKSKGNTIDPLEVVDQGYGADALRTYILFIGPYQMDEPWSTRGIGGVYRFLNRTWNLVQEFLEAPRDALGDPEELQKTQHKTIKKVTDDLRKNSFNTAIAALMEYVNDLYKIKLRGFDEEYWRGALATLAQLLAPFAPHMAAECFELLGRSDTIEDAGWPNYDEKYLTSAEEEVVVQINGKVRARLTLPAEELQDEKGLLEKVLAEPRVSELTDGGKKVLKTIVVRGGKMVNLVAK